MATLQIASDEPDVPSSETLRRHGTGRGAYQRKVRVTLTRDQAALVEHLLRKVATDPKAQEAIGLSSPPARSIQTLAKRAWSRTEKAIEKRDRGQRAKEYGPETEDAAPSSSTTPSSDEDAPLF